MDVIICLLVKCMIIVQMCGHVYQMTRQMVVNVVVPQHRLMAKCRYVMGGSLDARGDTNSLFALDAATLEWETLPSMKRRRYSSAAVAVDRFISVFGGTVDDTAERYNVNTQQWEDLPSMPTQRARCAAAAVQNTIYFIGGVDDDNDTLATVEVFDIETQKWECPSSINDMSVARECCAAVAIDGRFVVVIGGYDGSN